MPETNSNADSVITLSLTITGDFPGNTYPDWVVQRALKLDLSGWVKRRDDSSVEIQATGHRVLVEALQAACTLGPMDANVCSLEALQISTRNTGATFVALPV